MDLGGDLSFTPQELTAGAKFTYRGQQQSPATIMRENGANYVRLRLWVNPPPGYNDLASDLAMAKVIKAAGMKLLLDIQYSDFWGDPPEPDHTGGVAGRGPHSARGHGEVVYPAGDLGVRGAGHTGRHGGDRQ